MEIYKCVSLRKIWHRYLKFIVLLLKVFRRIETFVCENQEEVCNVHMAKIMVF